MLPIKWLGLPGIPLLKKNSSFLHRKLASSSLRTKILISYLIFAAFLGVICYICFVFYQKRERASVTVFKLDYLQRLFLEANRLENHFYLYELSDSTFYVNRSSASLSQQASLIRQLIRETQFLSLSVKPQDVPMIQSLHDLQHQVQVHQQIFDTTVALSLQHGFKDYGQEGRMRLYAHALENSLLSRQELLMLRRHEKDYIIRKDTIYVQRFFALLKRLQRQHIADSRISVLLKAYGESFYQLIQTDRALGLTPVAGYKGQMLRITRQINKQFNTCIHRAQLTSQRIRDELAWYLLGMLGCAFVFCILMSCFFSHRITQPLKSLTQQVDQLAVSGFETISSPIVVSARDEIGILTDHINQMFCQIQVQVEEVHASSEQLNEQNKELQHYNQLLTVSETQLRQMNAVKDRFFAILSHDLRGPLISAQNFMHLYLQESDLFSPEEMKQMMTHSSNSIKHMINLLDNLLSWSLMQINHIAFDPQLIVVTDLIEKSHQLLKQSLLEKKINFTLETAQGIDTSGLRVWADAHMLDFIIRNLLSNAIKFTHPSGQIRLRVSISAVDEIPQESAPITNTDELIPARPNAITEPRWLDLQVIDTGIGIAPHVLSKIQSGMNTGITNTSTILTTEGTNKEKGTGLGLLICHEFIRKHQGSIRFESEPGHGTRVMVRLPLTPDVTSEERSAEPVISVFTHQPI